MRHPVVAATRLVLEQATQKSKNQQVLALKFQALSNSSSTICVLT